VKIGFYDEFRPCIVTEGGVIDISADIGPTQGFSPQAVLEKIITNFAKLKPAFEKAAQNNPIPFGVAKLRAPTPRPGKVLCGERNYKEGVALNPPGPLKTFFKSPDAIIGPGETVVLPRFRPTLFNHEAELGIVIGKIAKEISVADALEYVFGYTTAVDVSARQPEAEESALPGAYGKSFDTFLPVGPWITTADEIGDPNKLQIRYWVNKELRQDYNTDDMEHGIAFFVATLSHVMTLKPGDLLLAGINHTRLGPLQNGDIAEIEIEGIGRSSHVVKDPLERQWKVVLRDPEVNKERRRAMKDKPNPGTWPFQPKGGG
jgi:2-keto-4-pentenoate hydratase/2-oxohepta-3-ene-1,7-dioic acid hydratase in catechol pathway